MTGSLTILAGKKALSLIRDNGLDPGAVDVVAGAAGGPKWLVLGGLDRAVFSSWLTGSSRPVFLVGSSIGSWRFAAIAQGMDSGSYEAFESAYLDQRYSASPDAAEVTRGSRAVMDAFLAESGVQAVLAHPFLRLNILSVRCRGPFAREERYRLGAAMLLAMAANTISRRCLGLFFARTLFSDPRHPPVFFGQDGFPLHEVSLSQTNLKSALMASGSIPLVMEGVKSPHGAHPGVYRDGGLIDYHLDLPFRSEGLVLFPHYCNRIVPGWFDKLLPWRRPRGDNLDHVVLISPSPDFVRGLPLGKIPDRDDFIRFRGNDRERRAYWEHVIRACRTLGDEFLDLVQSGKVRDALRPLQTG